MLTIKDKIFTLAILLIGSIGVIKVDMLLITISMVLIATYMLMAVIELDNKVERDMKNIEV